jgi:hypothetical protein
VEEVGGVAEGGREEIVRGEEQKLNMIEVNFVGKPRKDSRKRVQYTRTSLLH